MNVTPDLSHLTDNEKKIIEAVIRRQKAEEKRDDEKTEPYDNDYSTPSLTISSHYHSPTNESGVICQICQKTKFVNQHSSRQCSLCKKFICVRCCIRLKSHYYICNQCRFKQEESLSSNNTICKQYLSDYILSQSSDENLMNNYGANPKRILPKPNRISHDDDISSPESLLVYDKQNKLLPILKQDILRDFQYHSLEERDIGHESTLKDSGIDTASSSTILNVLSSEQFHKPITYWRFNETRTEQIGDIYTKTNFQGRLNPSELLNALGLQIQSDIQQNNELITQITKIIPGSIADTYGQLKIGDQIIEWNGEKLVNRNGNDIYRIISQSTMQSSHIHMIVKRSNQSFPIPNDYLFTQESTIEKHSIQLQLSFQYDKKYLHIMIYGAKDIPIQQGLFACQLSLQYERDISSKVEKCTKAQTCIAGVCTWNQRIMFFDIDTIDNLVLWIRIINLDRNQEVLGEIKFNKLNLNNKAEWYSLTDPSVNKTLPSAINQRKRQLPDIPTAKLHANREKVSQDLFQKAAELKLRLHMQSKTGKTLITQRSFDQTNLTYEDYASRQSMINLSSSSKGSSIVNLKDKPRISMIRDRSVPNPTISRRITMIDQNSIDLEKNKLKSLDDKHRKSLKKRHSLDTPADDIDSDGSELSSISKISSNQPERSQPTQKPMHDHFVSNDAIQLKDEELRQIEMRTHDTMIKTNTKETATEPKIPTSLLPIPTETVSKIEQRNDGTVSDSALSSQSEPSKKRRPSIQSKAFVILGLSKKANSSSNLGYGKRCGFQRSEEIGVQPHLRNRALERQTSKDNDTPTSAPPLPASQSPFNTSLQRDQYHSMPNNIMKLWSGALKLPHERQFTEFVQGLGKGQLVGRQVLASPCHGEIQIGLRNNNGLLEVEIVRARNLLPKPFYKIPPATYVKVYLLNGKTCVEKQRTRTTRRTLDPLIQQTLTFKGNFRENILQITIWGDYGKLDRKAFMGVCQINLDDINLNHSQQILDWYKLFSANSLLNNYTIVQQSDKTRNSVTTIDRP